MHPPIVAVYGTLRKGQHNYKRFLAATNSKFLGTGHVHGYDLINLGAYPGAVVGDHSHKVFVDVFEVSLIVLDALDRLESVPVLYRRESVTVHLPVKGKHVNAAAYMYVLNKQDERRYKLIPGGDWLQYLSKEKLTTS